MLPEGENRKALEAIDLITYMEAEGYVEHRRRVRKNHICVFLPPLSWHCQCALP